MSAPTEEERLEFQHRKLKAEVAVLERPWYRSGTAILTGVAVVTSLLGSGVQFARSQRQFDLATIKYERTQLDIAKLELEKKRNDSLVALAAKDIAILSQLRHGEEAKLTRAESSLAVLQRNLANPKGTTELYHSLAVKALAVVVDQLRDARRDQPRIDLAARDAAGRVEQLRSSGPQSVVAAKPAASAARR